MSAVAEALATLPANHLVVDGEVIVPDYAGRASPLVGHISGHFRNARDLGGAAQILLMSSPIQQLWGAKEGAASSFTSLTLFGFRVAITMLWRRGRLELATDGDQ
jgi:hypothetical protein